MFLDHKNLLSLPVETKSGLFLGKIKSFEIDSESHQIERYMVRSQNLIDKILGEKINFLLIGRNQVISLNDKKMVVVDEAVGETAGARGRQPIGEDIPVLTSSLRLKIDGE